MRIILLIYIVASILGSPASNNTRIPERWEVKPIPGYVEEWEVERRDDSGIVQGVPGANDNSDVPQYGAEITDGWAVEPMPGYWEEWETERGDGNSVVPEYRGRVYNVNERYYRARVINDYT